MGKRNKRLTMKKYAIKYAAIRKNRVEETKEAHAPGIEETAVEEVVEEVVEEIIMPNALKQLEPTEPAPTAYAVKPAHVSEKPQKKIPQRRRRKAKPTTKKTTKVTSES
tara:strand:+ start:1847 stop:2173 length:327 start_codon:yes stop_codon:yes gene_type:complete